MQPLAYLTGKDKEPGVPGTILLITDGASPSGSEALSHYCRSSGHQLIVYAIGRERQDRPGHDDKAVFHGATIPLAVRALQDLAADAGGSYVVLTADKSDIKRISRRIGLHFMSAEDQTRPWIDAGYYPLFPMAGIFVLWFRKGWTLTWAAGLLFASAQERNPGSRKRTRLTSCRYSTRRLPSHNLLYPQRMLGELLAASDLFKGAVGITVEVNSPRAHAGYSISQSLFRLSKSS